MRRLLVMGMALVVGCGLVAACDSEPERPADYLISYTVENLDSRYRGYVDIEYRNASGKSETIKSEQNFRFWSLDLRVPWRLAQVGLRATMPKMITDRNYLFQMRCTISVNGLKVSDIELANFCTASASLVGFTGPASPPATLGSRPPGTWPPFTTGPPRKPAPTQAKPRPAQCRLATDAEISNLVTPIVPSLAFQGVTTGMNGGCLYRFAPVIPVGPVDPLTGVTVVSMPGRVPPQPDDEPVPGLAPARRSSDSTVYANLPRGYLMVIAQFPTRAAQRAASEAVYRLVRSRR